RAGSGWTSRIFPADMPPAGRARRPREETMRKKAVAGALTLLCLAAGAPVRAAEPFKPTQRAGYFFVGGHYEAAKDKTTASGQMYVTYRAPERVTQAYP